MSRMEGRILGEKNGFMNLHIIQKLKMQFYINTGRPSSSPFPHYSSSSFTPKPITAAQAHFCSPCPFLPFNRDNNGPSDWQVPITSWRGMIGKTIGSCCWHGPDDWLDIPWTHTLYYYPVRPGPDYRAGLKVTDPDGCVESNLHALLRIGLLRSKNGRKWSLLSSIINSV